MEYNDSFIKIPPKYKMATTAIVKLGDISRNSEDICVVYGENDENFYGNWITGLGFFDVQFPKETTRDLTEKEIKKYSKVSYEISSGIRFKLNMDKSGNRI